MKQFTHSYVFRAWSSCRNLSDGWTDTTNDNENKDWPTTQASPAPAFTDLVPEFEPGKPWKGSQLKNIEDDPSITPGSVARSPLSINPMPKDAAEIFTTNQTNKNSPTDLPPLSLSSSTWSFNPSLSNQNFARLVEIRIYFL
ncbi:TNRC6C.2 family protein [Megaselia abdita]